MASISSKFRRRISVATGFLHSKPSVVEPGTVLFDREGAVQFARLWMIFLRSSPNRFQKGQSDFGDLLQLDNAAEFSGGPGDQLLERMIELSLYREDNL
jgi:hypothetical protein